MTPEQAREKALQLLLQLEEEGVDADGNPSTEAWRELVAAALLEAVAEADNTARIFKAEVQISEAELQAERQRGKKLAAAVNQWLDVDRNQGGCDQLSLARAVQAYEEARHAES